MSSEVGSIALFVFYCVAILKLQCPSKVVYLKTCDPVILNQVYKFQMPHKQPSYYARLLSLS